MIEISEDIKDCALEILKARKPLPTSIPIASIFWLSESMDETIHAFGYVVFEEKNYKIGTKKIGYPHDTP